MACDAKYFAVQLVFSLVQSKVVWCDVVWCDSITTEGGN